MANQILRPEEIVNAMMEALKGQLATLRGVGFGIFRLSPSEQDQVQGLRSERKRLVARLRVLRGWDADGIRFRRPR